MTGSVVQQTGMQKPRVRVSRIILIIVMILLAVSDSVSVLLDVRLDDAQPRHHLCSAAAPHLW